MTTIKLSFCLFGEGKLGGGGDCGVLAFYPGGSSSNPFRCMLQKSQ